MLEKMILPPILKAGDRVGIVAPARKIFKDQLDASMHTLASWGLQPRLAQNIFSTSHSYLAGTDAERRADFQEMIDDPEVKAIFCARGGYGSTRIVDDLNFSKLKSNPKWIIGFSDITALHLRLITMGCASIHGTMPIFFSKDESASSIESLQKILFSSSCEIQCTPNAANRIGHGSGEVIGGNLSLILDALKTSSEPDTNYKILVVEEVDEYFYKLDRMFTQLRRIGKLKNLAGLLIGHMTDIKNSELAFGEDVAQIVMHAVRDYHYPVAFSFPTGHQNPNLAWIHGGNALLDVTVDHVNFSYPNIYSKRE